MVVNLNSTIDTDSTFTANSPSRVPSQSAVKSAIDNVTPKSGGAIRASKLFASNGIEKEFGATQTSLDAQGSPSNGDYMIYYPFCNGGETKLNIYVSNGNNRGIFDIYINGMLDSSGYDLYYSSTTYTLLTITLSRTLIYGYNEIKLTVNGKNTSSSSYSVSILFIRVRQ